MQGKKPPPRPVQLQCLPQALLGDGRHGLRALSHSPAVEHTRDEYVRDAAHTNTIEGYFSVFKRGMKGVYQHCDERHLHCYLAEFDFRYSNRSKLGVSDAERAEKAVKGIVGKRLTYQRINEPTEADTLGQSHAASVAALDPR